MKLNLPPHFKQLSDGLRGAIPCTRDAAAFTAALLMVEDPSTHARHTEIVKALRDAGVQRDAAAEAAAIMVAVPSLENFTDFMQQIKNETLCTLDGAARAAAVIYADAAAQEEALLEAVAKEAKPAAPTPIEETVSTPQGGAGPVED